MKKFILIIFLFTFTPNISAQSSSVTVEGNAEISIVPDRASLNLAVELNGRNLSAMTTRVAETIDAFLTITDGLSINRNDVMTS